MTDKATNRQSLDPFMEAAIEEGLASYEEGGMPIGSVLVLDGEIIGRGRNQREQKGSVILHAEMDAIENAGIYTADQYLKMTLYTTLSPCPMCSGTIHYLGISRVVIADNETIMGAEEYLKEKGVELEYQHTKRLQPLLAKYQNSKKKKTPT